MFWLPWKKVRGRPSGALRLPSNQPETRKTISPEGFVNCEMTNAARWLDSGPICHVNWQIGF